MVYTDTFYESQELWDRNDAVFTPFMVDRRSSVNSVVSQQTNGTYPDIYSGHSGSQTNDEEYRVKLIEIENEYKESMDQQKIEFDIQLTEQNKLNKSLKEQLSEKDMMIKMLTKQVYEFCLLTGRLA